MQGLHDGTEEVSGKGAGSDRVSGGSDMLPKHEKQKVRMQR